MPRLWTRSVGARLLRRVHDAGGQRGDAADDEDPGANEEPQQRLVDDRDAARAEAGAHHEDGEPDQRAGMLTELLPAVPTATCVAGARVGASGFAEMFARRFAHGRMMPYAAVGSPSSASANASGSNGARSSGPSPRPTSFTGTPRSRCTASTIPPFAVPSSLVSTIPVMSTTSAKTFACITPF